MTIKSSKDKTCILDYICLGVRIVELKEKIITLVVIILIKEVLKGK